MSGQITKTCVICKKEFAIPKSSEKRYTTCGNHKCRSEYRTGKDRGGKLIINCAVCGIPIQSFKSRQGTRKVCHNPECLAKIRSLNLSGKQKTQEHNYKNKISHLGKVLSKEWREHISESKKGDKSPQWQGGISFYPYCEKFNNEFKRRVRARFDYTCVLCGIKENGKGHSVHHVHYDKKSCCAPTSERKFVLLCPSCHAKTNYPNIRDYWVQYFEELLAIQYSDKSYLTKEEYAELM